MKIIKEYDKIRLKTGEIGTILEIFRDGNYMAEVLREKGDIETTEIKKNDILSVFEETEYPISQFA